MEAVELETNVGSLWVHRIDEHFTPSVAEHGFWEPHLVRLLEARLRPGATFVDVGAHVGYFSVLASRLVEPGGRVVAIEPAPSSLALLRANLDRHRCANVRVVAGAAWDAPARLRFQPGANPAGSSVSSAGEGELVQGWPLDELVSIPVDLLKVDAEGSDYLVIAGARRLLERCPLAVVEFWPRVPPKPRPCEPRAIAEGYRALGRELAVVTPAGELEPISVDELLALEGDYVELGLTPAGS